MLITKDWCQERWPLLSQFPFLTTNAEQPDKIYSEGWRKQGIQETLHDQSKAQLSHNTYVDRRSTNTNCNWKRGLLNELSGRERHCFKGLQKLLSLQSNTTAQRIPAKFQRIVIKTHNTRNLDKVITFIDTYHSEPSLCTCTNPRKDVAFVVTINNEPGKKLHCRGNTIFIVLVTSWCWEKAQSALERDALTPETCHG